MLYRTVLRIGECLVVEPFSIQDSAADFPINLIFNIHA